MEIKQVPSRMQLQLFADSLELTRRLLNEDGEPVDLDSFVDDIFEQLRAITDPDWIQEQLEEMDIIVARSGDDAIND
ncbi:hypothetical protein NE293_04730 [Latilactobacillus curvatus]|uniref:hypothetical protein n=1 Tax=Latilactobacillus curvatus TaxID=28038 RepID=UPI0020734C8B|nr:hypothetical protein [Latilactobacillus curvatus]WEU69571.1 hypothetical protein [Latilactobacillus phage TMW 1.1365 P3]MCM6843980.1 hypothetical protein [Latilactobacillus curvatus]MCM6861133.1 hypothetical protein [Latilactobacillus curvatus]MCM6868431.1 hypothetical protein [Latilactobacillus curvatus]MDG2981250.1 hypothetical protein [Latilactobacillus curvatus]